MSHRGATYEDFPGMAVLKSQTRVGNQMGETIGAAEQVGLRIVREALVGTIDGSIQRQVRSRAGLVLHVTNYQPLRTITNRFDKRTTHS